VLSLIIYSLFFFFSSRRRHTRFSRDWSSDVCSSDLLAVAELRTAGAVGDLGVLGALACLAAVLGLVWLTAWRSGLGFAGLSWLRSEERRVGKECRSGWSWCV